ncbi:MAG: hypothetical protein PHR71_10160, partial [Polaromonas sp.]|nr:hypothetical protein [Polaromonas sp.]
MATCKQIMDSNCAVQIHAAWKFQPGFGWKFKGALMTSRKHIVHPGWLRAMHWLNALVVFILMMSGWRIYNATAFLGFAIPYSITLGGWLGGAIQWHFA